MWAGKEAGKETMRQHHTEKTNTVETTGRVSYCIANDLVAGISGQAAEHLSVPDISSTPLPRLKRQQRRAGQKGCRSQRRKTVKI